MVPSDQGLDSHHFAGDEVDLGLEPRRELMVAQALAHARLELEPISQRLPVIVVEERVPVPSPALRLVQGRVGVSEHRLEILAGPAQGDADTDGRDDGRAPGVHGFAHHVDQSLGECRQLGRNIGARHHHCELVTSESARDVRLSDREPEPIGDRQEDRVTGGVAERVVDDLEPVHVDHEQCGRTLGDGGLE